MITVRKSSGIVSNLLGIQDIDETQKYRKIDFCIALSVDGKKVAFNTFTCELVELTDEEYDILNQDSVELSEKSKELIEKWFLVPKEHNDIQLVDEVRSFVKAQQYSKIKEKKYTIFPTTDCNARCYYCFELAETSRIAMDEKTAHETAEFICKTLDGSKAQLIWFGGEPLFNSKAIDIICSDLRVAGVEYTSRMVSNGYLFDGETIEKAKNLWNLGDLQITLDGSEDTYNRVKAYIYKDVKSPFITVIENIENIATAGIHVKIRLNMSRSNYEELYELIDFIADRYKGLSNIKVYTHLLYETERTYGMENTISRRISQAEKLFKLEQHCIDKKIAFFTGLPEKMRFNACMADSPNTGYMILPNGKLGLCEHFTDSEFIGSLSEGITDYDKVASYSEIMNCEELCKNCKMYPLCMRIKKCPTHSFYRCDVAERMVEEKRLERSVEFTYRYLMRKKQAESK